MRLRIGHTTTFTYDQPVSEGYTELRLRPLDAGGQHCLAFSLVVEPADDVLVYTDRFGNDVRHFDLLQPHLQMRVTAISEVVTPEAFVAGVVPLSLLDEYDFLQPTTYAPHSGELAQFAVRARGAARGKDGALAVMSAVHAALIYEKGATNVHTTAAEALQLGRGVCQDFAHLLLAAYRTLGLPARYVSGYLHDRHNGQAAASHAWVDVNVSGQDWISVDPTHNREQTAHYVRVAVGRDYADVPPTRGVFTGNGREVLDVNVRVAES